MVQPLHPPRKDQQVLWKEPTEERFSAEPRDHAQENANYKKFGNHMRVLDAA
jgi:hypothetical protein